MGVVAGDAAVKDAVVVSEGAVVVDAAIEEVGVLLSLLIMGAGEGGLMGAPCGSSTGAVPCAAFGPMSSFPGPPAGPAADEDPAVAAVIVGLPVVVLPVAAGSWLLPGDVAPMARTPHTAAVRAAPGA